MIHWWLQCLGIKIILDTLVTCYFFPSGFSILQQSSPHSLPYSFFFKKILLLFIPKGLQKS